MEETLQRCKCHHEEKDKGWVAKVEDPMYIEYLHHYNRRRKWVQLPQKGFSPGLEGLRGLAIIFTSISHISNGQYAFKDPLGAVGVTIFFVLSGYNIMGGLQRHQTSRDISKKLWPRLLWKSHMNRWKRLFPTILVMVIVIVTLYISSGSKDYSRLAHCSIMVLTYTQNFSSFWMDANPGYYCNMWSLSVTEQYNLLSSIFGPFILNQRRETRRNTLIILIVCSYLLRLYTGAFPGSFFGIDSHFNVLCNISRFATGALLRIIKIPRVLYRSSTANIGILLCLMTIYLLIFPQWDYSSLAPGFQDRFIAYTMWSDPLIAIAACLIIIGSRTIPTTSMAAAEVSEKTLSSPSSEDVDIRRHNIILESPPLQFMGKISYPFYCFQLPIQIYSGWSRGWNGLGFESIALLLAAATHFWFDVPLQKYLKRKSSSTPSVQLPA